LQALYPAKIPEVPLFDQNQMVADTFRAVASYIENSRLIYLAEGSLSKERVKLVGAAQDALWNCREDFIKIDAPGFEKLSEVLKDLLEIEIEQIEHLIQANEQVMHLSSYLRTEGERWVKVQSASIS
jgi:hypothetical protein